MEPATLTPYSPKSFSVPIDSLPEAIQSNCELIEDPLDPGNILNTAQVKAQMKAYEAQNKLPLGTPPTLILLDFRTFCYPIHGAVSKWRNMFVQRGQNIPLDPYHAYYLKWLYTLTSMPDELRKFAKQLQGVDNPDFRVVIMDDCPTILANPEHLGMDYPSHLLKSAMGLDKPIYWRHVYEPEYKGGRKSKPDQWQMITSSGYEAAEKLGIPIVKEVFMEADDLIAQYVRDRLSYNISGLAIWTVDTDLLQLVSSDDPCPVVWYNTPYAPYYRDEKTAKEYWLKRWKHQLSHPSEIAAYKAKNGDASDNLPPGTDIGLIDLLQPKHHPTQLHTGALSYPLWDIDKADKLNTTVLAELLINQLGVA